MNLPLVQNNDLHIPQDNTERAFASIIYDNQLEDEARKLCNEIHKELQNLFHSVESDEKSHYRNYTLNARNIALEKHRSWLDSHWLKYCEYFADSLDINPSNIQPRLELVTKQSQRNLFRLARLSWSLPHTYGYGRRLNYLIWDDSNNKLIGILGLQSPPLSLPARDKKYNIPRDQKTELVNLTMDAYTVGAIPPYNNLLGGKLVVLAAASQEIRKDYEIRYEGKVTQMLDRVLPASLIAITTLSAFGRSSLYNRVHQGKIGKRNIWATFSLGGCQGWGTLHFSDSLYEKMKIFHRKLFPDKQLSGFGTGSKIRFLVTNRILKCLGFEKNLLRHNIKREVFIIPHVENLEAMLSGQSVDPIYNDEPFEELAAYWKKHYCIPRSERIQLTGGRDIIAKSLNLDIDNIKDSH